jgi:hypothetical protein
MGNKYRKNIASFAMMLIRDTVFLGVPLRNQTHWVMSLEEENFPARNEKVISDPRKHDRCLKWRDKSMKTGELFCVQVCRDT